ncbi:MFS general substrate transporter [Serendipita vermifera]|nr:MFS general substrate transporter [Serendipita vermifera]
MSDSWPRASSKRPTSTGSTARHPRRTSSERLESPIGVPFDQPPLGMLPEVLSPRDEEPDPERWSNLPWYKRPSPVWLLVGTTLAAFAMTASIAPRLEIYIKLACQEIRPDYNSLDAGEGGVIDWPSTVGTVTLPRPSAKCQGDPDVQQAVAELGATISAILGILSCLTAGWWGQFCDRHGRTKVLAITVTGALFGDFIFILVGAVSESLPFGFRFLIAAPIIEGILGGLATGSAATHAYLSDTTTPLNRSRVFSLMLGLMFCGMVFGPTLGGLMVSRTNNLLSVFYMTASTHIFYLVMALFVVPESLPKEAQLANREEARKKADAAKNEPHWNDLSPPERIQRALGKIFFFLSPLDIFLPRSSDGTRRRWNLTILALSYGVMTILMGSYQFKFQYASYSFGWNSEQLGYLLSVVAVVRATYLIAILPALIKWFHPKPTSDSTQTVEQDENGRPKSTPHDPKFDLKVARFSLITEIIGYVLAILSPNSTFWAASSIVNSFGSGFSPSVQSLAVDLSRREEPTTEDGGKPAETYGQLFGALGVLQAMGSQMIGPIVFGAIFTASIHTYPKGIFVAAAAISLLGLLCLSFIRIPRPIQLDTENEPLLAREEDN